jgi:glycosyltransferase involved in cell wall biosynthesis
MTTAILIPCFNSAKFLFRLVESINNQSVPFNEVICYDDGSTDNTIEVAESFGLKIINGGKNNGASYARNRLIEASTSDWIHFHDSDDVLDSRFNETMISAIDKADTQIICNAGVKNISGLKIDEYVKYTPPDKNPDYTLFFLKNIGQAIVGFYNRNFLIENNILFLEHLRFNEDPDFHVRLAYSGAKFKFINESLVFVIGHPNSSSIKHWWSCISNKIFCLRSYLQILPANYHFIIAQQLADTAYYSIRSGQFHIGYRAMYVLKKEYQKKFTFSNKLLNIVTLPFGRYLALQLLIKFSQYRPHN